MWRAAVWALLAQAEDACAAGEEAEVCLLDLGRGLSRQPANASATDPNVSAAAEDAVSDPAPAEAAVEQATNATRPGLGVTDEAAVQTAAQAAQNATRPGLGVDAGPAALDAAAQASAGAAAPVLESAAAVIARLKAEQAGAAGAAPTGAPVQPAEVDQSAQPDVPETATEVIARMRAASAKNQLAAGQLVVTTPAPAEPAAPPAPPAPPAQPRESAVEPNEAAAVAAALKPKQQRGFPKSNPKTEVRNAVADRLAAAKMGRAVAAARDVTEQGGVIEKMAELEHMIRRMPDEGDLLEEQLLDADALTAARGGPHAASLAKTAEADSRLFRPLEAFGAGRSLI